MASGNPSRWRQRAAMAGSGSGLIVDAELAARERSRKRRTAGFWSIASPNVRSAGGSGKGSTGRTCSPRTRRGARLVARICRAGHAPRRCATTSATSVRRCSQLSRIRSVCRVCKWVANCSAIGRPGAGTRLTAVAIVKRIGAGSVRGDRSTQRTPSPKDVATPVLIAWASRVLPTPPGPVSVRRATACSRMATPACSHSPSRPMNRVRGCGMIPEGEGGKDAAMVRPAGGTGTGMYCQ